MSPKERLLSKVNIQQDGCWIFTGSTDMKGYGHILYRGENVRAHRVSWLVHFGEIPNDLHVLHKCDCRGCVNPDHLYLGTNQDNVNDRVNRKRSAAQDGESNGNAYLKANDILQIRELLAKGYTQPHIAGIYKVSSSTIGQINRGLIWRQI